MEHPEITSPFRILTLPVKMVLCQLTYTTNRQIHISTFPHGVVILNIAPTVFRTAKLSESNAGKSYVIFGKANNKAINLSDIGTGGFVINGENEQSLVPRFLLIQ
jgi:hypothetical protein